VAVLNPALAAAIVGVSVWRKLMNSLIWQSVIWRPGKLQFLIGVKNPLPIGRPRPPENAALAGPRPSPDSRPRSGYALPSSRIRRHFLILIDVLFLSCSPRSRLVGLSRCRNILEVRFRGAARVVVPDDSAQYPEHCRKAAAKLLCYPLRRRGWHKE
jgi:hypothetical protein